MLVINIFSDSAGSIVSRSIAPAITDLALFASALCTLFLILGGYQYITSAGDPNKLERAKKILKNALIGLVIVLSAAFLGHLLSSAYGPVAPGNNSSAVPNLSAIKPDSSSDGLITIIIKALTGVLSSIIQTVAAPFLKALTYFTSGTPLISANHRVFDLWVSSVGIADALIVLVVMMLGLHVMGYISLGLEHISVRSLLPQIGLVFVLINSSMYIIDSLISLSNILIRAISGGHSVQSVWQVLTGVVSQATGYSLAALIIMTIFVIFSVILLIFYIGRIVTIYLGAVLAPLVILCWLLPSTRDTAISACKRYFSSIFVLFIHVIILELAASLLAGMVSAQNPKPDPLMAMVVGLATLIALLKTQGVMNQLSYATIGPRMARKITERLVMNTSYITSQAAGAISGVITTRNSYTPNHPQLSYRSSSYSSQSATSYTPPYKPSNNNKKDKL